VKTSAAITLIAIASAALLSGCKATATHSEPGPAKQERNPLEIQVTPALRQQIKLGEPKWADVADELRVAGRVEADATRLARIGSSVTGRITDLLAMEGEHVRRGQVLATLHSTELSDAQFGFIKAFAQLQLSQRSVNRAKQLLNADVIGAAELQRRESEVLQASAEVAALRQQLGVLGMTDEAIKNLETTQKLNSEYQIVSSIDGTVLERKVTVGQIIQPAEIAYLVADLSNVWLVADIPEQDAGDVAVGKAVQAEIPAFPGRTIRGRLAFVGATVSPESRTVRAHMNLGNSQGRYKPAMLATITLKGSAHREQVIPGAAVVREENADHVFVQVAENTFLLRKVSLGDEYGDSRVLASGLEPGEKIVIDGAFHLNNERKRLLLQGGA
jgi:membrane fusion protein, heavy metal efflux system